MMNVSSLTEGFDEIKGKIQNDIDFGIEDDILMAVWFDRKTRNVN